MRQDHPFHLLFVFGVMALIAGLGISGIHAQEPEAIPEINWLDGPCDAPLGDLATLSLPEGYAFCGQEGAIKFLELSQNPTSGNELGVIISQNADWFVVFEFDDSGYVKDDEKDNLDADAILSSIREGTEEANNLREKKGWAPLHIRGWRRKPYYDPATNNLTWSINAESENEEVVNHSIRLLGRRGVMNVDLVGDPESLASGIPEFDNILKGFSYNPGHRYSEFKKGDKLAKYGLTALIVGGAGALALKSGLFAKFWKLILIGLIAIGGAIAKFFKAIFRRGVEKAPELPKQD